MIIQRLVAICAVALIGLFGVLILAQGHARNGADRTRDQHTRFDARDREIVGEWYKNHQDDLPAGFRAEDRLTPNSESSLRVSEALDPSLRSMVRPVPSDLLEKLPPPARDYRYAALDGHLLLLNEKTWNVSDVLHFELDFGVPSESRAPAQQVVIS